MRNTDFMNLSLPEGSDKIDIEILNSDFTAIENLLEQHAIIETMTLNGEGVIIGAIGPYIRLQNIDAVQVSIDIGEETFTLASGENIVIRETAENIGIITSGDVNITYFVNPKTYADKEFYTKEKVDELLSNVEVTVEVDAELSETSENPVQNKVITAELASYATTAEVESKVTEKVAEIVAGAPEDFDTLKEMSDWLKEHEDSAASMNSAIQKNASDIETANTNIQKNVEDIATANTDITDIYNNRIGGKNVFKSKKTSGTNYELTMSWDNEVLTVSGVATETRDCYVPGYPYITTGSQFTLPEDCIVSTTFTNTQDALSFHYYLPDGTTGYKTTTSKFEFMLPKGTRIAGIYFAIKSGQTYDFTASVMMRPVKIKDKTFTNHIPSNTNLQDQINALAARISALEGATATTEGGE